MLISEKNAQRKLRPAEQQFVDNIARGMNQTDAYRDAYPKASDTSAIAAASRKLSDVNIQAAITARKHEAAEQAGITPAMVIGGVNEIAFGSIADIPFTDYGTIDWEEARARGVDRLIKSIRITQTTTGVTTHYEMYSRLDALKELADYLGIKQKPRENDAEIEKVARSYNAWCRDHADATEEEKLHMLHVFAKGGSVPIEALESRVQDLGSVDQNG